MTSISRYDGSYKLSLWLCQVAKHIFWKELRKRKWAGTEPLPEDLSELLPDERAQDGLRYSVDRLGSGSAVLWRLDGQTVVDGELPKQVMMSGSPWTNRIK